MTEGWVTGHLCSCGDVGGDCVTFTVTGSSWPELRARARDALLDLIGPEAMGTVEMHLDIEPGTEEWGVGVVSWSAVVSATLTEPRPAA